MTLREFVMNFLDSTTIVNIYVREYSDIDTPVHLEYGDTVDLLLNHVRFINLLSGKVEYVEPSFHKIQPMIDIHISMESDSDV